MKWIQDLTKLKKNCLSISQPTRLTFLKMEIIIIEVGVKAARKFCTTVEMRIK